MTQRKPKLSVVKVGGNVINDPLALKSFLADFAALEGAKVLVHGGGRIASDLCRRLDIPVVMVEGRRVTDRQTLDVAVMVYAGLLNKQIVADLQSLGCNAIGLSGADGNVILASKRKKGSVDFGFVGDVERVNPDVLSALVGSGFSPVICAITHDGAGQLLNTNADTVAASVAVALSAAFDVDLVYCIELPGVMTDPANADSVIPKITPQTYSSLKEQGTVKDGMIPKLDNAFSVIGAGAKSVWIKNASALLSRAGTLICDD